MAGWQDAESVAASHPSMLSALEQAFYADLLADLI
jgi:hypothetical protein